MSCEKNPARTSQSGRKAGISGLAARAAFYAGVGLATAGVVGGAFYRLRRASDRAAWQRAGQAIAKIQTGARLAGQALEAGTPDEDRRNLLSQATFEVAEAWQQVKRLSDRNERGLQEQLADFTADVWSAIETVEETLDRPGDVASLDRARKVFQSSRLVCVLPRPGRGNQWRASLLAGGATGLAAAGATGLAVRRQQAQRKLDGATRAVAPDRIAAINWQRRTIIGGGGLASVYRVAPGVAAKVGEIKPEEVEAQRHFARQGMALPVLDYQAAVELPAKVSREACPVHGHRREFLPEGYDCTCGQPRAVLLMPTADDNALEDVSREELQAFMMGFSRDCEQQLGHCWDARPANVARYQGRLVALDFGEEEF